MKIKLAHVQVIPQMSGVQTISYDILKNLSNDKYDKYIIFGAPVGVNFDASFYDEFETIGVKVILIPSLKREIGKHDLESFKELYSIFKEYKFDIVHTNSTKPGIIARIAAKLSGVTTVIHTVHGISYHKFLPKWKRAGYFLIEYISSLFSNHIVLVNNYYKKYYKFIPFVNVLTIHNGVDFSALQVDKSKKRSSTFNLLFLSRLDHQKDPITLLKAISFLFAKDLLDRDVDFLCTMAGDGALRKNCEEFVNDNGLSTIVKFTGWCSDKSKLFNNTDLFCVPSLYEAFGLVFVEAAYFSIPSVSTKVEGIPEVIDDDISGVLVAPKNVQGLAYAIADFVNNREKLNEFGVRSKIKSQQFDVFNMVNKYDLLYSSKYQNIKITK